MPISPPQRHFGVYAAILRGNFLLAVRKCRGPYSGYLDLPGGAPLPGESMSDALGRELEEEIGGRPTVQGPWSTFDLLVTQNSLGEPIEFHHKGLWRYAIVPSVDFNLPAIEDVDGCEFVNLHAWSLRSDLSVPLKYVLNHLSEYCLSANLPYPIKTF